MRVACRSMHDADLTPRQTCVTCKMDGLCCYFSASPLLVVVMFIDKGFAKEREDRKTGARWGALFSFVGNRKI